MINLVSEDKLPAIEAIADTPTENLMEVYKFGLQMEALCEREGGIGLSAVQAGVPWRMFVVKSDGSTNFARKGEYGYFINCDYTPTTEQRVVSLEGCLSLRSPEGRLRHFQVERYSEIRVTGFRLNVNTQLCLEKYDKNLSLREQAVVFQHEIDHHRAVLIKDIGAELFLWS